MAFFTDDIELWPRTVSFARTRGSFSLDGAWKPENSQHRDYRTSYPRFKRDCLLDRELQNYVFLEGRFHAQKIPREPSVDTAKAGRYVGCHSRGLVIVVT